MSLKSFVNSPHMRDAFARSTDVASLRKEFSFGTIKVAPISNNYSLVGTAFDYLARFVISREINTHKAGNKVTLHEREWVAEHVVESIPFCDNGIEIHDYNVARMINVRALINRYVKGENIDINEIIEQCQWLARLDYIYRVDSMENYATAADPQISQELLRLIELFKPLDMFKPSKYCILNPTFKSSRKVGGADADLVVDDLIIEIKTTKKMDLGVETLRQLAGYAVLSYVRGMHVEFEHSQLNRIGIYYSRYGEFWSTQLLSLFKNKDSWEEYCAFFNAEMTKPIKLIPDEARKKMSKAKRKATRKTSLLTN